MKPRIDRTENISNDRIVFTLTIMAQIAAEKAALKREKAALEFAKAREPKGREMDAKIASSIDDCFVLLAELQHAIPLTCDGCRVTDCTVARDFGCNLCLRCKQKCDSDPMLRDEIAYSKKRGTGTRNSWAGD